MSELMLGEAFKIAVEVHGNQRDKSGEPYLGHVCRVMSAMETDTERCVAILHDALEDCDSLYTLEYGRRIGDIYGVEVIDAVIALTRFDRVFLPDYMDYIRRLSFNPLAVKVKLSDLADNMRRDRLRKLPALEAERLYQRYHEAYCFLTGKNWEHEEAAEVIEL